MSDNVHEPVIGTADPALSPARTEAEVLVETAPPSRASAAAWRSA